MQALRQLVEDVRRLVHPAPLLARRRPYLAERLPEAERAVGDGKLRRRRQTAPLEIEQEVAPGLGALAHTVGKADQLLLALRRRADDYENALRLILKTRFQIDAIDPPIDVPFGGQIALAPAVMLLAPRVLEAGDGRSRQARRILADQRRQRLLEVAGRDTFQVEDRDQRFEALRPPRIARQDVRTHRHGANAGHNRTLGKCPCRTIRRRPSAVVRSAWRARNSATS